MLILRIRDPFVCILYCVVVSFNSREFIFSCVISIVISFISPGDDNFSDSGIFRVYLSRKNSINSVLVFNFIAKRFLMNL